MRCKLWSFGLFFIMQTSSGLVPFSWKFRFISKYNYNQTCKESSSILTINKWNAKPMSDNAVVVVPRDYERDTTCVMIELHPVQASAEVTTLLPS